MYIRINLLKIYFKIPKKKTLLPYGYGYINGRNIIRN